MPAAIGVLSRPKTGRRKLVSDGVAEGVGFEPAVRIQPPLHTRSAKQTAASALARLVKNFAATLLLPRNAKFVDSRRYPKRGQTITLII